MKNAGTDLIAALGRFGHGASAMPGPIGNDTAGRIATGPAAVWLFCLALPMLAFATAAPAQDIGESAGESGYSLHHYVDPNAAIARPDLVPDPVRVPAAPVLTVPQLAPLNLGPVQAGIDTGRMGAFAATRSNGLNVEATMDAPNLITAPTSTTGRLSLGIEPSILPHGLGLSVEAARPMDLSAPPGDSTAFAKSGTMTLRGDLPVGDGSDLSLEARRNAASGNALNREVYLRYKLGW